MKTTVKTRPRSIQQRLQSRISQRRNLLGALELEAAKHKASPFPSHRAQGKIVRQEILAIAEMQRLDKDLFVMVLESAAAEREMQFFMDAVAAEADKGLFGVNWNFFGAHAHG